MTVLEVIQKSTEFLARKGVDSPRLQVEWLLARVLGLPRLQLYLNFDRPLDDIQIGRVREWVRRRGAREPLQHILGSASFCGLEITVNRHVLIPRPETEILAEQAWRFLNGLPAREGDATRRVLDFGTGSGCIAIAIAAHSPHALIWAIDVSPEALAVAQSNAAVHNLGDRIRLVENSSLPAPGSAGPFDLIVSNPPYIPSGEIAVLMPEVRDYDPRLALDGGPEGLDHYHQLGAYAAPLLDPEGRLMIEVGDQQAPPVTRILESHNWIVEPPVLDYSEKPRVLVARRPSV